MNVEIDVEKYAMTPLMVLAAKGDMKSVSENLASGTDVNAIDNRGGTALMYAVMNGRLEMVRVLLENGANPNLKTKKGFNATDFAAQNKSKDIAQCLKEHIRKQRSDVDVALWWAKWVAIFCWFVILSGMMKSHAPILGRLIMGNLIGGLNAVIFGGITFGFVLLVIKLRGKLKGK